jgi:hypothetical protein
MLGEEMEEDPRPMTPVGQTTENPLTTPGKKKAKRKATSPMPAITPTRLAKPDPKLDGNRTSTGYLYLARKAIHAAIDAEKRELGEEYIADNDIQLLNDELETILAKRPMEMSQASLDSLELQGQLNRLNARLDTIALEIKAQSETAKAQKPESYPPTQPTHITAPPQGTKPRSFAEALKSPSTSQAAPKVTTYRERRLILKGAAGKDAKIEPMKLRNQINEAFKDKAKILTPVVGLVTRSLKGDDIVLATTEKFDAEFLNNHEAIWKPLFNFNKAVRDTTWGKIVIHGVPTEIFNNEEGMTLLEEEIKVFNGLNPVTKPRWLSSKDNRDHKKHGSVAVYFETKEEADRALRNRLQIAGISMRTAEYTPIKPTGQKRTNPNPRPNPNPKCSNCQKEHEESDKACKIRQDLVKKGQKLESFSHMEL